MNDKITQGKKRIEEYCRSEAKEMILKIKDLHWSIKMNGGDELYIEVERHGKTGDDNLPFAVEEIEAYADGKDVDKTNQKIHEFLFQVAP